MGEHILPTSPLRRPNLDAQEDEVKEGTIQTVRQLINREPPINRFDLRLAGSMAISRGTNLIFGDHFQKAQRPIGIHWCQVDGVITKKLHDSVRREALGVRTLRETAKKQSSSLIDALLYLAVIGDFFRTQMDVLSRSEVLELSPVQQALHQCTVGPEVNEKTRGDLRSTLLRELQDQIGDNMTPWQSMEALFLGIEQLSYCANIRQFCCDKIPHFLEEHLKLGFTVSSPSGHEALQSKIQEKFNPRPSSVITRLCSKGPDCSSRKYTQTYIRARPPPTLLIRCGEAKPGSMFPKAGFRGLHLELQIVDPFNCDDLAKLDKDTIPKTPEGRQGLDAVWYNVDYDLVGLLYQKVDDYKVQWKSSMSNEIFQYDGNQGVVARRRKDWAFEQFQPDKLVFHAFLYSMRSFEVKPV